MYLRKILIIVVVVSSVALWAAAPLKEMNYQGKLTNSSGVALDETVTLAFCIYDTGSAGTALWGETLSVEVINGLFDVVLGKTHPLNIDFDRQYWLELSISTDGEASWERFSPREKIYAVPYAFRSTHADTATNGSVPASSMIQNQNAVLQSANATCSGVLSAPVFELIPDPPDTFTNRVGMLKSTGSATSFKILVFDGTCWRQIYPSIDTSSCR